MEPLNSEYRNHENRAYLTEVGYLERSSYEGNRLLKTKLFGNAEQLHQPETRNNKLKLIRKPPTFQLTL
jgi:hypothetical protein